MEILTTINGRGRTVLAKFSKELNDLFPVQYANNTQAKKKLAQLGDEWEILQPVFCGRGLHIAKKVKP